MLVIRYSCPPQKRHPAGHPKLLQLETPLNTEHADPKPAVMTTTRPQAIRAIRITASQLSDTLRDASMAWDCNCEFAVYISKLL